VLKQQFVLDAFWQSNLLEHSIYVVGKWTIWTNYQKTNDNQMFQKNMEKWTHYNSSPIIKKNNAWIIRTNYHNFPIRKK